MISRAAWEGLQKPVTTFSSEHIQKRGNLCTGIPGDCDTFHYDHWHQLCSTAKVGISSPSYLILISQFYINRLAALPQITRSATRESLKETIPAQHRERLASMCSMKSNIVSRNIL